MDSLTGIVMALATGAAAALKPTAEQAIKDGYAALKELITRKYTQVQIDQLEAHPNSKNRRGVAEEELAAAGVSQDVEVLHLAQALLEAIQRQAPETAAAIGVDLKDVEGASLAIRRVMATGVGVKVAGAKLSGDLTIEDVRAGGPGGLPPNP
jgi:flagellar capping protein FliD